MNGKSIDRSRRRYLALGTAYPALTLINALQTSPRRLIVLGKKANLPPLQLYVFLGSHLLRDNAHRLSIYHHQ